MIRTVVASLVAMVVVTAVLGLGYPALMTGFAQLAFPDKADASLVSEGGTVLGSRLAGQEFTKPEYFHGRLSATSPAYNAAGTTFSNLGPTNPDLAKQVDEQIQAILRLERPYNAGLTAGEIPVDAVTTSGSGIDPHISPAYAKLQAPRIAAVRDLDLERVLELVDDATDGRFIGFWGEPGVNVLELNLSLDQESDR